MQLGYRQELLTPYAGFALSHSLNRVKPTGLEDNPDDASLNAQALAIQQASQMNQRSWTLGLRYDFAPLMALKLQADYVRFDDSFLHFDRRTAPRDTADMTVFSVAFDFIF